MKPTATSATGTVCSATPTATTRRTFLKRTTAFAAGAAAFNLAVDLLAQAPNAKLSVGVIGVGAQGTSDMRGFLAQPDARVTAVCDLNRRNLENARKVIASAYGQPDVKVFADYRELNADPTIDAVLMALPVHWHSLPALDAIGRGKHLFHEKPMAMSFEEARRVRAAVRQKGVVFQFGTQQRSDPKFRWACALARSGRLGKLKEIHVSVPGGKQSPVFPEQPLPEFLDWNRWIGPAPMTPFNEAKLQRDNHENMTNFSLGMISCWGIHHLDIAQWGNDCDATGPATVAGEGEFPKEGGCDAILRWKVRFEYAQAAPVVFVNDGTPGFEHGARFIGDTWLHVRRGAINSADEAFLRDPQNQEDKLPVKLPVSRDHTRNFLDAIKAGRKAICDIETAVRGDTLCQLALIAVKTGRKLQWDPQAERFPNDAAANQMLQPRAFRGEWQLPA